jgi:hypothetical protein
MRLTALAVLALSLTSGCYHITTKVPGVLDLRSDGSGAETDSAGPKDGSRTGFDAILWGDGVQGSGQVTVVDRKYWFIGLIPMGNESATEEIGSATGTGALKGVMIGEQYTLIDFGIGFCATYIPIAGCFVPPRDFKLSGSRVKPSSGAAASDLASPRPVGGD